MFNKLQFSYLLKADDRQNEMMRKHIKIERYTYKIEAETVSIVANTVLFQHSTGIDRYEFIQQLSILKATSTAASQAFSICLIPCHC